MRKRALFLAIAACGAISFDVEVPLQEQTIQGNPIGGLLPAFVPNPFTFDVDIEAETKKRDTGPATSAEIKSIEFASTPRDRPSGTFDFLDEVHIFIETNSLPKKEIAFLKPVPKNVSVIKLEIVRDVNVLPYIGHGARITATASGRQPSKTFTYDGKVIVTVHV